MTSFLTHRSHVHDARLPLRRGHSALRTCITLFAPYGFRATYHHLTLSAAIPRRLEADQDALVRAVEELQKRAGRRAVVNPLPWWLRSWWEGPNRAWYEHPFRHPSLRLPEYVRRQNAILDGADLPGCPDCGDERPLVSKSTGHGWVEPCRGCAWVLAPCPCGQRHRFVPETPFNWKGIWQRAHMSDDGMPNPRWSAG